MLEREPGKGTPVPRAAGLGPARSRHSGLVARVHFATHIEDFDRSRAFHRNLGWPKGMSGFPLTNADQMARGLRMFDIRR